MDNIFEEMRSQAVPDDSTVSALIERLPEKQRKRRVHFSRSLIAAAAALAVLTVTAGAASGWTFSFLGDFSSVFGGQMEQYNIVESASYSNSESDLQFELVGVTADSNLFRAMVDIYPPEGTEFTEENKPLMNGNIGFEFSLLNAHESYGSGGRFDILSDTPQKMRVLWTFDCSAGIENREIGFYANRMTRPEDGGALETERIWCTNIKTGSVPHKMKYKVDRQKILFDILPYDSYMERAEMTVTGAEVGSMSVKLTGLLSGELLWHNTGFSAKKTDGTDVGVIFSGGTSVGTSDYPGGPLINADSNIILLFDDVVDPADIASVKVGNTEIIFR